MYDIERIQQTIEKAYSTIPNDRPIAQTAEAVAALAAIASAEAQAGILACLIEIRDHLLDGDRPEPVGWPRPYRFVDGDYDPQTATDAMLAFRIIGEAVGGDHNAVQIDEDPYVIRVRLKALLAQEAATFRYDKARRDAAISAMEKEQLVEPLPDDDGWWRVGVTKTENAR